MTWTELFAQQLSREAPLSRRTLPYPSTPWKLLVGGRAVLEKPRHEMIAETVTHLAHHRGQLTVYLRLNDVPVPSLYGPSADEGQF